MAAIYDLPELQELDARRRLVRIPPETDVPLTPRVAKVIDTAGFRRLSRISQLGLVSLVYPAAHHSRFEHSLGVYRTALLYLRQLSCDEQFTSIVSSADATLFLVATLLHDIGHWPFCHPLEDMRDPRVPRHEELAADFLHDSELSEILRSEWNVQPSEVVALLEGRVATEPGRLLGSLLSGPIDVDKMDYLDRDSLHAGVPYGSNFDRSRLIGSLCLNESGDALAITEKGRTAAEMMVFARYVMFSEVYWHHAVRSATAMLQRAFFLLADDLDLHTLFRDTEQNVIGCLLQSSVGTSAEPLLTGLFGPKRKLYKRLAQYSLFQQPEIYGRLVRRPYDWLVRCAEALAEELSRSLSTNVSSEQVLIDAPPRKREGEINTDVFFPKENCYRPLTEVSPVVRTLAREQFDDYVKRVRVFVPADIAEQVRNRHDISSLVHRAVDRAE